MLTDHAPFENNSDNDEEEADRAWHKMTNDQLVSALNEDASTTLETTTCVLTTNPINKDNEIAPQNSMPHDRRACCDNASGNHVFKDIEYFTRMYSNSTNINVNVYTGSYVLCKQQGDIAFTNVETGETETIRNVLYLPKAMMNIISEGELTKQNPGHWFLTAGKKRLFGKPGRLPIDLARSYNRGAMKIRPMPLNASWTPHSNYEIQCYVTVNGYGNSPDKITEPSFTDFFTKTHDKISEKILLIQNWNSADSMNGTDETMWLM